MRRAIRVKAGKPSTIKIRIDIVAWRFGYETPVVKERDLAGHGWSHRFERMPLKLWRNLDNTDQA